MELNIKKIKKYIIYGIMILIIIFCIVLLRNVLVNKVSFEEKDYKNIKNILNLYVLNDGTLRVEENIKLDKNEYSTYFLVSDRYDEVDYKENIENLKVYYNDIELNTDKYNEDGYYIYKYDNKYSNNVVDPKGVEVRFSRYNNIEVYLPDYKSNLKIVYELKDYVVNYNDISYFQFNLNYGLNIFEDETLINIIMPESSDIFDIYNNIEFVKKSITKEINSSRKEIYFSGLEKEKLHLEVVFDKNIVDSNFKINEDKHLEIKEKNNYNKIVKENLVLNIRILFCMILSLYALKIINKAKYKHSYGNIEESFDKKSSL